jgi:hypothetical protein
MESNDGAVFFVDILGFSALTKGEVTGLKTDDYKAWGRKRGTGGRGTGDRH